MSQRSTPFVTLCRLDGGHDSSYIKTLIVAVFLALVSPGCPVVAGEIHFNIPKSSADIGLKLYVEQAGRQVLFPYDQMQRYSTNAVNGLYAEDEALRLLLDHSGLEAVANETGTLTIRIHREEDKVAISKKTILGVFAGAIAAIFASTPGTSAAQQPSTVSAIEEVIVTAQKRSESIQDVPISIQAVTGDQMQSLGVMKADDILKLFPNLSSNGNNGINTGFTIRGVGTNNFHGNVSPAVGIYTDEIVIDNPYSSVLGIYDMERVEVVRGPQNTLFGRNTTGGAVNYISNRPRPGDGLNGYVRATYGSYNQADLDAAVGLDLGQKAAARVAIQTNRRDGLFNNLATGDNEFGDRERYAGRIQLAWKPTEKTNIQATYSFGRNRGEEPGNKANGLLDPNDLTKVCPEINRVGQFESATNCVDRRGFNPSSGRWKDIYNISDASQDVDIDLASLKLDHEFDWFTLNLITAFVDTDVKLGDEAGGTRTLEFTPAQDSNIEQFSQEIRLVSPADGALRWLVGAYYFQKDLLQSTNVRRFNGMDVTAFNILDQDDEDISVYGKVDYDILADLTFIVGVRYTDNQKSASSQFGVGNTGNLPVNRFTGLESVREATANAVFGSCPPPPVPCLLNPLQPRQKLNEFGGNAMIQYRLSDEIMIYGSASRGFKTGGFDTRALAAFAGNADRPVKPEFLNAYEIGFKTQFFNDTLQFNVSGFYYDWRDLQTFSVIAGIPGFFNIAKSELVGGDFEAKWVPAAGWFVQGGLGLVHTNIEKNGGLVGIDEGHALTNAPPVTFNGLIIKEIPLVLLGQRGTFTLQTDFRYVDKQVNTLEFAENFVATNDDQFYINFRTTYKFGNAEQYEVSFWGENLTEERYCPDIGPQDDALNPAPLVGASAGLTFTNACQATDGQRLFGGTFKFSF